MQFVCGLIGSDWRILRVSAKPFLWSTKHFLFSGAMHVLWGLHSVAGCTLPFGAKGALLSTSIRSHVVAMQLWPSACWRDALYGVGHFGGQ